MIIKYGRNNFYKFGYRLINLILIKGFGFWMFNDSLLIDIIYSKKVK